MIQQTIDAKPRGQHPTVFDAAALRLIQSATARIAPRLSDGWPHSAASQVSL